jgi:aspartate oxidase
VKERRIPILYETPARQLIQHDVTKEILGVRAERGEKPVCVKARRAVVLTCGGFENNQEMIRNYLPGVPYCYTSGSPYNEGDGIAMAMSVGARSSSRKPTKWRNDRPERSTDQTARHQSTARLEIQ